MSTWGGFAPTTSRLFKYSSARYGGSGRVPLVCSICAPASIISCTMLSRMMPRLAAVTRGPARASLQRAAECVGRIVPVPAEVRGTLVVLAIARREYTTLASFQPLPRIALLAASFCPAPLSSCAQRPYLVLLLRSLLPPCSARSLLRAAGALDLLSGRRHSPKPRRGSETGISSSIVRHLYLSRWQAHLPRPAARC